MNINELKYDEKGLIPAVVVDFFTKKVLTVAYMNKESLQITLDEVRPASSPVQDNSFGARVKHRETHRRS